MKLAGASAFITKKEAASTVVDIIHTCCKKKIKPGLKTPDMHFPGQHKNILFPGIPDVHAAVIIFHFDFKEVTDPNQIA